jgi:GTP-binding protein
VFSDQATIWVEGGDGGDGSTSFRREAHVPRGGPDGGDGGRGGDVVVVCDDSRRDLSALRYSRHHRAGRGGHGKGKLQHGARGEDRIVLVPPGTSIAGLEGRRYELLTPGQRAIVAAGGIGGHGNKRFTSSTRQSPHFAERGLPSEEGWIDLQLKLMADAGLVGMPNAGKSSLLARLTRAKPKIADYPFTTLDPVLGTIEADDRQLVLADIPGLIEGAADGAGLGHEFLAHVERCRALLHVVELAPVEGAPDPLSAYETVRAELEAYGAGLAELPELILLSKRDLLPEEDVEEALAEWGARAGEDSLGVLAISSATGAGIDEMQRRVLEAVPAAESDAGGAGEETEPEFESEHEVYRPAASQGFEVEAEAPGEFRVRGRGIEMLVARHDISNIEALAYLEGRLREIGVIAALQRAGFEPGDDVHIGETVFELDPG